MNDTTPDEEKLQELAKHITNLILDPADPADLWYHINRRDTRRVVDIQDILVEGAAIEIAKGKLPNSPAELPRGYKKISDYMYAQARLLEKQVQPWNGDRHQLVRVDAALVIHVRGHQFLVSKGSGKPGEPKVTVQELTTPLNFVD